MNIIVNNLPKRVVWHTIFIDLSGLCSLVPGITSSAQPLSYLGAVIHQPGQLEEDATTPEIQGVLRA